MTDDLNQWDRKTLTEAIEKVCAIEGKQYIETENALTVIGGPKYIFTKDGEIKSIIRAGESIGPEGKRGMR